MGANLWIFGYERFPLRVDVAFDYLQAIFRLLREEEVSYANVSARYFRSGQFIRRPDEVLASGAGNCIEGALLFASFLELYGLEPVVALSLLNGHAFVGLRSAPGSSQAYWIETTMVGTLDQTPQQAFQRGNALFSCWSQGRCDGVPGQHEDPDLFVLDIKQARELGFAAHPL